jgi:hypothetical protein
MFWLDPVATVDALLIACCNSTSTILMKVACSRPSAVAGRCWVRGWFWMVEGCEEALSPDCERCWLILLCGIIRVVFRLRTRWTLNVGI